MKIFCDTEFTDFNDPKLISIGLVTEDGRKFYGELIQAEWRGSESAFVTDVVLPKLSLDVACTRPELADKVAKWLNELHAATLQVVTDYVTDYQLLLELLEDYEALQLKLEGIMTVGVIASAGVIEGVKYNFSHDEINHRIAIASQKYREEFAGYFSREARAQHHALHDAEAMREGYAAALREIQRCIYHRLQR